MIEKEERRGTLRREVWRGRLDLPQRQLSEQTGWEQSGLPSSSQGSQSISQVRSGAGLSQISSSFATAAVAPKRTRRKEVACILLMVGGRICMYVCV